jgi:tRNA(adenine34) deaminase
MTDDHAHYMNLAYQEALKAFDEGEVPVGAVVVKNSTVVGRGYNRIENLSDASAHAEIIAIGAASNSCGSWRLNGCALYVTLEPCCMCLGAILLSRLDAVIYGAPDPRFGAVDSHDFKNTLTAMYGNYPAIIHGIMADECSYLLQSFFSKIRKKN